MTVARMAINNTVKGWQPATCQNRNVWQQVPLRS